MKMCCCESSFSPQSSVSSSCFFLFLFLFFLFILLLWDETSGWIQIWEFALLNLPLLFRCKKETHLRLLSRLFCCSVRFVCLLHLLLLPLYEAVCHVWKKNDYKLLLKKCEHILNAAVKTWRFCCCSASCRDCLCSWGFGGIWMSPWTEETCDWLFPDISHTNELRGWETLNHMGPLQQQQQVHAGYIKAPWDGIYGNRKEDYFLCV